MPDPLVVLDSARVAVRPGSQASVKVQITNSDRIVNGFRVSVVGDGPAQWAEVGPDEVRVMPGEKGSAVVTFSPPAGPGAPGGSYPFGVRVVSMTDSDSSAVAEGDLEVGTVEGLHAKLTPVNSSGRWQGKHTLQITNSGNAGARVRPTGSNPDEALGFLIRPPVLDIGREESAVARVFVRTRHPTLRGVLARIPFTLALDSEGAAAPSGPTPALSTPARPVVEGAFNQKPILARFVIPVAMLTLVAAVAGVIYLRSRPLPEPAQLGDGSVPTVRILPVRPVDAHSVLVSWEPVAGVDGYYVQSYAKDKTTLGPGFKMAGEDRAKAVSEIAADTTVCFSVYAIGTGSDGKARPGAASEIVCGKTLEEPSPSPSPSASPQTPSTGSPPPSSPVVPPVSPPESPPVTSPGSPTDPLLNKYVAVGDVGPSSGLSKIYDAKVKQLKDETTVSAAVIRVIVSSDYTVEGIPLAVDSFMVVAGPYESMEAAAAACTKIEPVLKSICQPALLKPR